MVLAYVEGVNVRIVVLGSVVVESGWEEDMAWLLAGWQSSVSAVKGTVFPVVVEVGDLSAG